jgi:hypothetical protein
MVSPNMENEPTARSRPIGLSAVIGVFLIVALISLFLVVFYKPFPLVTVINAADHPLENVVLQTVGSEAEIETHDLGALQVGQSQEVSVRSYEATVLSLQFELLGETKEHKNDPLPIKQGQAWTLTVEPGGKVTAMYLP